MQPDDERLSDFDDELENRDIQRDEENELYATPLGSTSYHRLTDAFYATETKPRHSLEAVQETASSHSSAYATEAASLSEAPPNASLEVADLAAIRAHIEKYLGKAQPLFTPEENYSSESSLTPVEILHVAPTPARPFHTLVTCGMSSVAMSAPSDEIRYAEIAVTLPADWPVESLTFDSFNEQHSWPLQWLQILANLPHEHDTWLGRGHTVPNGDPAEAFSEDTEQCCMILLPPFSIARDFRHLQTTVNDESKLINFHAMVPIYKEEMELKLKQGSDALVKLFRKHGITDVLDPVRRNVCKKHRWWF